MAEGQLKVKMLDGRILFQPEGNIERFKQIFYGQIKEIIHPEEDGKYPEEDASLDGLDLSHAVTGFRKENELLTLENDSLKEKNSKLKEKNKELSAQVDELKEKIKDLKAKSKTA